MNKAMQLQKIPATIVTGFLGSGKTTLLSNILKSAAGKRIAVIVNEFGELDIDADLLRSCPLDCAAAPDTQSDNAVPQNGIYELANGCICCTVEQEFLPVMQQLLQRPGDIDHILIETSGLALPKPLVQAFNWPQVKQHCTVDSVITMIDGPALAAGRIADNPQQVAAQRAADQSLDHASSLQELLADQLASADMVIISKADLLNPAQLAAVKQSLQQRLKPEVKILAVSNGEIANQLIIGLAHASEDRIEAIPTHHDHHHQHGEAHHHAHDDFNSASISLGEVDADKLLAIIQQLVATHTIYRVKGFLALPGKPMRQVLQGVGERVDQYFDRLWRSDEPRQSKLVLIGKDLDQATLEHALSAAVIN